jgi:glutamate synthase (NADPH/NADH)
MTRRFVGDGQGKLTGVEIVGVKMERDATTGQFKPTEVWKHTLLC